MFFSLPSKVCIPSTNIQVGRIYPIDFLIAMTVHRYTHQWHKRPSKKRNAKNGKHGGGQDESTGTKNNTRFTTVQNPPSTTPCTYITRATTFIDKRPRLSVQVEVIDIFLSFLCVCQVRVLSNSQNIWPLCLIIR